MQKGKEKSACRKADTQLARMSQCYSERQTSCISSIHSSSDLGIGIEADAVIVPPRLTLPRGSEAIRSESDSIGSESDLIRSEMEVMLDELDMKWKLNAISTGAHIIKGKIFRNLMVDVQVRE